MLLVRIVISAGDVLANGENSGETLDQPGGGPFQTLTAGYRFFVVESAEAARDALAVRQTVYTEKVGRPIDVPDELDERAWLLAAKDIESDAVVGTMRVTPRERGPFECEKFFDLPLRLTQGVAVEITRFAVLPQHRKRAGALPTVSLGLFRLSTDLCRRIDARWVVIASQEPQIETYRWLGFEQTGIVSDYGALAGASHELLWHDFRRLGDFSWHGMHEFFGDFARSEIVLPETLPEPGAWLRRLRRGRAAAAGQGS